MPFLADFIATPYNPRVNFNLALEYERINQTAAAASFYLRAAEKTNNPTLQYIALIRNALCFEKQGNRDLTVKTLLQRAISIKPDRPEGYYLLSKLHERRQEYHDLYMVSCIGLSKHNPSLKPLPSLKEYFEEYKLQFQKSVGAWWVGLTEESRKIQFDLHFNVKMDDAHSLAVTNNLNNTGYPERKLIYMNSLMEELKHRFDGIEKIRNNYSQVYQDMFVLTMLNGKQGGTYLEIGSGDPFYNNNTALLETVFDWDGISIELNQDLVAKHNVERKNKAMCHDASTVNYAELLKSRGFDTVIDYLQVDCDPPEIALIVLERILKSGFKFRTITFEHDHYGGCSTRQPSRDLLTLHGYTLKVNDASFDRVQSFEDWWILEETGAKFASPQELADVNYVLDLFLFEPVIVG